MSTKLVDMRGESFKIGDRVARAYTSGRASNLMISVVTNIKEAEGKIYLDDSKVAINYPGRLLIVSVLYDK